MQQFQQHGKIAAHGGCELGRVATAWDLDVLSEFEVATPTARTAEVDSHFLLCKEMNVMKRQYPAAAFGEVHRGQPQDGSANRIKLDVQLPDGSWNPIFADVSRVSEENSSKSIEERVGFSPGWLEHLQKVAATAQFGDMKSNTNKIDPQVRSALEIGVGKWRLQPTPLLDSLASTIGAELGLGFTPELEPYKMNIYREGDFFKPHVDAPVDPANMIGTLVIGLPVQHEGGELVINPGKKHSDSYSLHPTARGIPSVNEGPVLTWLAMFSDVEHEVEPVTKGHRVTVTYLVKKPKSPASKNQGRDELKPPHSYIMKSYQGSCVEKHPLPESHQIAVLARTLQQIASNINQKTFGVLLERKYTSANLERQALKGIDDVTYRAFLAAFPPEKGHNVVLHPVCYQISLGIWPYWEPEEWEESTVTSYRRSDLLHAAGLLEQAEPLPFDTPVLFFQPHADYEHKYGLELSRTEQKSAEHTGNESLPWSLDASYRCGAIICTLAPQTRH